MEHDMQMQSMQKLNIERLKALAEAEPDISVLWLYGSRARGTYSAPSDYDLAVAFDSFLPDALETRLRPELLALEWQEQLGVELSILDINKAPLPLAITVENDDRLIFGENSERRFREEQRIMSMWELDYKYSQVEYA